MCTTCSFRNVAQGIDVRLNGGRFRHNPLLAFAFGAAGRVVMGLPSERYLGIDCECHANFYAMFKYIYAYNNEICTTRLPVEILVRTVTDSLCKPSSVAPERSLSEVTEVSNSRTTYDSSSTYVVAIPQ